MLYRKRTRKIRRKSGWYLDQYRPHFDRKLDYEAATLLVENPQAVKHHAFMPTITFLKQERRYRSSGSSAPRVKVKTRPLAYVSNRDGYIYSYYAAKLQQIYDDLLEELGLGEVVIGYRKGRSNISLAKSAFDEISQRGSCSAIALDIRGFFDNISHSVLKACWAKVLGMPHLPDDHYRVFSGLTTSRGIPLKECMARLGLSPELSYGELPRPLCSIQTFREQICGHPASSLKAGIFGPRNGIPQGTPISAVAANISMLEFDLAMLTEAKRLELAIVVIRMTSCWCALARLLRDWRTF